MSGFYALAGFSIADSEITLRAVRSSGPGGQNVNKVSTKVVLRFSFTESLALSAAQKERLSQAFPGYLTRSGELVLACDETRSQETNRELVLSRLAALLKTIRFAPRTRHATKPTRASKERRLEAKQRQSSLKKTRRAPAD
jgi:ribosome-associated protein